MATADPVTRPSDRQSRRRPFASWVKRLTNLKSSDAPSAKGGLGRNKKETANAIKNNPYPQSGHLNRPPPSPDTVSQAYTTPATNTRNASVDSLPDDNDVHYALTDSNKSAAPTVATNPETIHSDAGQSRSLTTKTGGGMSSMDGAGANSTFSSPNQSQHSLATTLTTMQSTSPGNILNQHAAGSSQQSAPASGSVHFSHQYPINPAPSALPPHLAPHGHPSTYSQATANNLLTDDASILTLASSSKRRRRRSMDTDASVRALAPSSVWGGSRESLPLSVLSGNMEHSTSGLHAQPQSRPSIGGVASAERASIYSNSGVAAPALASDRNSYYAVSRKQQDKDARSIDGRSLYRDAEDGKSVFGGKSLYGGESLKGYEGSIRSGAFGHGRNDSIPGSVTSPLVSPLSGNARPTGLSSRRSSIEKEDREGLEDDVDGVEEHEHDDVGMESRVGMQDDATA